MEPTITSVAACCRDFTLDSIGILWDALGSERPYWWGSASELGVPGGFGVMYLYGHRINRSGMSICTYLYHITVITFNEPSPNLKYHVRFKNNFSLNTSS